MNEEIDVDLEEIKAALDDVCLKLTIEHHCETKWTRDVLQSVADIAPENVLLCSSCFSKSRRPHCYAEWLYDMTWYTEGEQNRLIKIVLVLESEWLTSEHELKYDFEKLLQAKCKTKVFICQSEKAKSIAEEGIKAYAKENKTYHNEDERYLIAIYEDSKESGKGRFHYHLFNGVGGEITGGDNEEVQR